MPESRDSLPSIKQESFKTGIKRFLDITNKCLSGEIKPIDAFHQIIDHSPKIIESSTEISSPPLDETTIAQNQTNSEINQIRQELGLLNPKPELDTLWQEKINKYIERDGPLFENNQDFSKNQQQKYQEKLINDRKFQKERKEGIKNLKKQGVENPEFIFDAFASRDIIYPYMYKYHMDVLKENGISPEIFTKGIDRLNAIGFNTDGFTDLEIFHNYSQRSDSELEAKKKVIESFKKLSSLTDQDFQNNLENTNQYYFLKNSDPYKNSKKYGVEYFSVCGNGKSDYQFFMDLISQNISPDTIEGLNLINANILVSSKQLYSFQFSFGGYSDSLKDSVSIKNIKHIDLSNVDEIDSQFFLSNSDIFIKNINKFRDGSKIINVIKKIGDPAMEKINELPLVEKNAINFLLKTQNTFHFNFIRNNFEKSNLYFDQSGNFTSRFYQDYFSQPNNPLEPIPLKTIESFPLIEDQEFWKITNNLDNFENTAIKHSIKIKKENYKYFLNDDSSFNIKFLNSYVKEGNLDSINSIISPDFIKNRPPQETEFWQEMNNLISEQKAFAVKNFYNYKNYLDQGHFNSNFYYDFLKEYNFFYTIPPEALVNFSPEDKNFWNMLSLCDSGQFNKFVTKQDRKNPVFFDSSGNGTSKLYEVAFENIDIFVISPELLSNFVNHDQKFWQMLNNRFLNKDKDKRICTKETLEKIVKGKNNIIIDISDVNFIDGLFGQFEKRSNEIIQNYIDCVNSGIITPKEKNLITDFLKEFRIISPAIISQYKEAKLSNNESVFISYLKEITEKMSSSQPLTEADRQKPFYKDLIKHVYNNNVGHWTSYERNDKCSDRSGDISQFSIQKKYQIDLLSQSQITIKNGEILNRDVQSEVQESINKVLEQLKAFGFDKNKCNDELSTKINEQLAKLKTSETVNEIKLDNIKLPEDQLFILLAEAVYGDGTVDINTVKELMIAYEFINYEDIRDYINGTNDRVSIANNKDYALLCELNTFYADRIKDINKRIIETALKNEDIVNILPKYFKKLNEVQTSQNNQSSINKLQIEKLGLSQGFVEQLTKTLNRRSGGKKTYSPEETKQILERYESFTHGLSVSSSTSKNKNTQAFYGQIKSQREKTFSAASNLGQKIFNPQNIHLGEINLSQLLETQNSIQTGKYNQEQFTAYTAQKFMDIFSQEKSKIETELDKFVSESGKNRQNLIGYITKTKESANARMVGGVCVSGDNPVSVNKEGSMWNMPEYFQFVFQDPETLQCQGLVLMHHYIEDSKKVLTASLNPSSTYLYSVDEKALFKGILNQLEKFASDNEFDLITVSQNKGIRTNRTGGEFEKAIDEKVKTVGKTFIFSEAKTFSYSPNYKIQDMDVVWENKKIKVKTPTKEEI